MGGPIVRTGTTPAYWENWEKAFGGAGKKAAAKKPAKSTKPKAAKKKSKKK